MSWKERFYDDLAVYGELPDGAKIISAEDSVRYGGYCESCHYEDFFIEVVYVLDGERITDEISGKFADFLEWVDRKSKDED